ncbi:hypothetical protein K1X76_01565 [bacterium]|nr:hypothetical protein [bacterium]
MAEDEKNPGGETGEHTDGHIELDMDSTRMDIKMPPVSTDSTRTSIRVDIGRENTIDQPIKPQKNLMADLKQAFSVLWSKASSRLPAKKTSSFKTNTSRSKITPLTLVWMPHPDFPLFHKITFYLSRLVILMVGSLLFYFQTASTIHYFSNPLYYKWVFLLVLVLTLGLAITLLLAKKSPAWFVCLPFVGLGLHIFIHLYFFRIFETGLFEFKGQNFPQLLSLFWAAVGLFELALIIFVYPKSRVGKTILALFAALVFSEVFYLAFHQVPIETAWQGLGFFANFPYLFIRPIFLMLHVIFPLFFFVSLASLTMNRRDKRLAAWISANLLVVVIMGVLGLITLSKSRVPGLLSLVLQNPPFVGISEVEDEGVKLAIATSNYDSMKNKDDVDRLKIKMTPFDPTKYKFPKPVTEAFFVSAEDQLGTPVYFLERSDFILKVGGEKITQWYFSDAPSPLNAEGEKEWGYVAGFNKPALMPRIKVTSVNDKNEIDVTKPISFEKITGSVPLKSYEIKIDETGVDSKDWNGDAPANVAWPIVTPGDHTLVIRALSDSGAESVLSYDFHVEATQPLVVKAPFVNDFFGSTLDVALDVIDPALFDKIELQLDDKPFYEIKNAPYIASISTVQIPDGAHTLKVIAHLLTPGGSLHPNDLQKIIPLTKGNVPQIKFISPSLGEYVGNTFKAKVDTVDAVDTIELLINGVSAQKISQAPYEFNVTLPEIDNTQQVTRHLLTAVLKTKDGRQVSEWLSVEAGLGQIEAKGQVGGLNKVVFVIDASVSNWDVWDGKQKWDHTRQIFRSPSLQAKLKDAQVGVVMFGGQSSFSQNNCKDADWVIPFDDFKKTTFYTFANKLKPKGVSALYAGLAKAVAEKPQKIIVITDGGDSCAVKPPATLTSALAKNKTALDIVLLGDAGDALTKLLGDFVHETGGELVVPEKIEGLNEKVTALLSANYEVYQGENLVLRSPINGTPQNIKQGDYTLRLSAGLSLDPMAVSVKNGLKTKINLRKEGEAIKAETKTETIQAPAPVFDNPQAGTLGH